MKTKLLPLLLLFATACTFQVQVLNTPTAQAPEAILPASSTTPTPLLPSAPTFTTVPSTAVPAVTVAPTTQPKPSNEIQFPPNGTWQDITDQLDAGMSKTYTLYAIKDQLMSVSIASDVANQGGAFDLTIKEADGTTLCPAQNQSCQFWRSALPASGQYSITVTSQGSGTFHLRVVIDPPGTTSQTFNYADPQGHFNLSYSDEFAPSYYNGGEVSKFPPQLVLQYVDTKQYLGTNLGEAYFMIGYSNDAQQVSTCTQPASLGGPETAAGNATVNGITYTQSQAQGVGAGNIYEQDYYRTVLNGICYEITYFIHYSNIGNYTPGTVKEFDKAALLQRFDEILNTITLK